MKALIACFWFLLGALCVNLFDGEFKFRWRQLSRFMVRFAARQMPAEHQARLREEWLAELETLEAEGRDGAQVGYAFGVLWSVPTVKLELLSEEEVRAMADVLSRRSTRLFKFFMKTVGPVMILVSIASFIELAQVGPIYLRLVSLPLSLVCFVLGGVAFLSVYFLNRAEKINKIADKD